MNTSREQQLKLWLMAQFCLDDLQLVSLTGDAGFRCYFRFEHDNKSYIAVDAPPEKSNNQAFIDVQEFLASCQIQVPAIHAVDFELGFFCLTDLGNVLLAQQLNSSNAKDLYLNALAEIEKVAISSIPDSLNLAEFNDDFIRTELAIFQQWLLNEHLAIQLTIQEQQALEHCFDYLVEAIAEQPQVFMHRDYHSRNIMVLADDSLAVIDFQDAVLGPITYDLVSLLRDCYVRWPDNIIAPLVEYYRQTMQKHFTDADFSPSNWQRWFDLTGMQRHIKASGIFARLHHRDGKSGYLQDIPLTLSYIVDISQQYDKLEFLGELIRERVLPRLHSI